MALVLNDRVKETTTTTGQGTISLGGAATGFETFVTGVGDTNTTYYIIVHESDGTWEIGIGTVADASPDTLARTTVIDTSAGNTTKIDFAAGSKTVFCTLPASKAVFEDADNDVTLPANLDVGGNLTVTGNAVISGNLTFGDADTDSINLAAEIDSNIIPNTDNTYDLGSSSISASPLTSREPASSSPVSVMFLKDATSLLASAVTTLLATTVPTDTPVSL